MNEFPGLFPQDNFFDDGDDHIIGRIEDDEDPLDFGLREAEDDEIYNYNQQQNGHVDRRPDDLDLRMEGRGNHSGSSVNQPLVKTLYKGSQNTGPKGVLKDYKDSKNAVRVNRVFDDLRRERFIQHQTAGKKFYYLDANNQVQGLKKPSGIEDNVLAESLDTFMQQRGRRQGTEDEYGDELDDELVRTVRAKQSMLQHYQDEIYEIQCALGGSYRRVDTIDQLSALLKASHKDGATLIHLYDNNNPTCQIIHLIFEDLAPMFPHVVFVRARTEEVMPHFDTRFLPTFLIYRGTECKEKLIGVVGAIGIKPTDDDVVELLTKHQVLQMPTAGLDVQIKNDLSRKQFLESLDQDDDDSWLDAED